MVDASAEATCSVLFVGSKQVQCNLCTVWPLSDSVSKFQICVCVSGLVRLLSVRKFSLRQSASDVTTSLCSALAAGASLQSKKNAKSCFHVLNRHENLALRHNRYLNIAIARRPHEAMHLAI